jgi:sigma-B regulation protein RsbU (phosphoserine phosphatase)
LSEIGEPAPDSPAEDLEDLYENAPCGYFSLQPNGRIVKANATLSAWMGFPQDELIGKRLHDLLSVGSRIFYETHIAPLLRMQGFFHEVALDFVTASGSRVPVLANAVERHGPAGELLFIRFTIFQAADRRRYERELLASRDAALAAKKQSELLEATSQEHLRAEREAAEFRDQFIAVLGHDLRNPLSAIRGGVEMLSAKETLSERGRFILSLMDNSVLRMSGLIDNVLDFERGRLGGGIVLQRNADSPLTPVLRQVVDEIRAVTPGGVIESDFLLPDLVDCDHARIGQMLSNLLANAVTHGAPDLPVRVEAAIRDGMFELSVANGGAPIPPAAMERLFQPFVRGEVQASLQGLGLGLYIAAEIAKAHGGTLSVRSSALETRFTFAMPRG